MSEVTGALREMLERHPEMVRRPAQGRKVFKDEMWNSLTPEGREIVAWYGGYPLIRDEAKRFQKAVTARVAELVADDQKQMEMFPDYVADLRAVFDDVFRVFVPGRGEYVHVVSATPDEKEEAADYLEQHAAACGRRAFALREWARRQRKRN
jgi:hypothetical protein